MSAVTEQKSEAKIAGAGGLIGSYVIARYIDESNFLLFGCGASTITRLYEVVGGAFSLIGSGSAVSVNDLVGLYVDGTTNAIGYLNGVSDVTGTITSGTAGKCGLRGGGGTQQFDDFADYVAAGGGTTRGMPFGTRSTAFNGGRTFAGVLR
jgi:hypothetical protein